MKLSLKKLPERKVEKNREKKLPNSSKKTINKRISLGSKLWAKFQTQAMQSVLIVTFFMLFSRSIGFIRNILIYQKFDKEYSDMFVAAQKIPDLIVSIIILGTVVSSLLPVATRIKESKGKKEMVKFISLFHFSLIAVTLITSLGVFFSLEWLLQLTVSSSTIEQYKTLGLYKDFVLINQILLLGPIIFATRNLLLVYLTIEKKFLTFSIAAVVYNISPVIVLFFSGKNDYLSLTLSVILGGVISAAVYYIVSLKAGYISSKYSELWGIFKQYKKDFIHTWIAFLPRMFLLNGMLVANLLMNKIATESGQITAFDIGLSIQSIFLVLIMSLGIVLFPNLSKQWNEKGGQQKFFNRIFSYNKQLLVVGSIGFIITLVATPIVLWFFELFGKGQDNSDYIILVVRVLSGALIFQAVTDIITKYFYIRERIWEPVFIYFMAGGVQVGLTFYFSSYYDAGVAAALGLIINVAIVYIISMIFIKRDYGIFLANKKI